MRKLISSLTLAATLVTATPALAAPVRVDEHDKKLHLVARYEDGSIVADIERVQSHYQITKAFCATVPDNVFTGATQDDIDAIMACREFRRTTKKNHGEIGVFVKQWYCLAAAVMGEYSNQCTQPADPWLQSADKVR